MIIIFLVHNDFTITGLYQFFFYLVVVGFGEKFIYRGFLYNRLKGNSEVMAIILSGIFFGIPHAILPSLRYNADISQLLLLMCNQIGGGIVMGWYFIYLQEKSKTLWIPILIHAILDYSVGSIGIITAIGTFLYFLLKSKRQRAYSFSRNAEGSGIGLSLVKSIIELHGGKISAESKPNEGSIFKIELPSRIIENPKVIKESKSMNSKIETINIEFSDIYSI